MIENSKKKTNKMLFLLFAVIALQILCFVLTFAFNKQVFHEDEFFSYALSNSSGRPFIYGSKVQVVENYNSWETGDSFRYYVRTTGETAFDYVNVWKNQAADVHPPLYYALLHTISSFFPESFSWWWGFLLNLVFFAVTQVFLYKWCKRFAKSEYTGLVVCIFYGFTIAALNTVMFIRMYEMVTMFSVMLAYYVSKAADAEKLSFKKHLLPVSLTILGGALTQHFFLILAFVFVAIYCLSELCKKRFRNMFSLGIASFVGVAASFAIFPASVKHLFFKYDYDEIETDIYQQFLIKSLFVFETTGYRIPLIHDNPITYLIIVSVILLVVLVPILFLFRKELNLKERIHNFPAKIKGIMRNANYTWCSTIIASAVIFLYILKVIPYYNFEDYIDRYYFMIVPLVVAVVICMVFRVISLIKWRYISTGLKVLVSLALVGSLIFQNLNGNRAQYARSACESGNGPINSYLVDKDCILIVRSPIFLPCYSLMLENADDIFITLSDDNMYLEQEEAYKKLFEENDTVFLAFEKDCLSSSVDKSYDFNDIEKLFNDTEDSSKSETELSDGEEEMLSFFEENYNCSAEYCTIEYTTIEPYRVMLYKLTKN